MKNIIIIGTGLAGYTLARELRKFDTDIELALLTNDDGAFYSKPMLSNAFSRNKQAEELVTACAEKMEKDINARIITKTSVEFIDRKNCKIITADSALKYDKLVLALGANPITQSIDGNASESVLCINNLNDYRVFRNNIHPGNHVAIIGPGLIGCEFANDLVSAGYKISVIGPDSHPLGRLLPHAVGQYVLKALQQAGIDFHLNTIAQRIEQKNTSYILKLANGDSIESDLVLSAIGLRANTGLASTADLKVEKGIVVDRYLQTSDERIFAIGDCAEVSGHVLPFVMPIMHAARALAKTLTGQTTEVRYPAMPIVVKTPACPLVVAPPKPGHEENWEIEMLEDGLRAVSIASDNSLQGFVLAGSTVTERQQLTQQLPAVME